MSRFRKSDWLDLALRQLSRDGPDGLRLEVMCERAGRTRGSFYHHFEDHAQFLAETVDLWTRRQTLDLIDDVDPAALGDTALDDILDAVLGLDYRLELGIRELARRDQALARKVAETDNLRLEFSAALYTARFGLGPEEARKLATLDLATFAGLILIDPDMDKERQISLYRTFEHMTEQTYGKGSI